MTTSHYYILTYRGFQHACFIPYHRHLRQEFHTNRFAVIVGRRVGKHLQRTFIHHVHTQLVTTSTYRSRQVEPNLMVFFMEINHSPRSVIHRTCHHTGKRQSNIMLRCHEAPPFMVFQSGYTFRSQYVGKRTQPSCRFVSPMKVHQHLACGSFPSHFIIKVHHFLIVTVHKVHLDTFNSPLTELIKSLVYLFAKRCPRYP